MKYENWKRGSVVAFILYCVEVEQGENRAAQDLDLGAVQPHAMGNTEYPE